MILSIAIISYIVHLILIFLVSQEIISFESDFTKNPIAAIYTPFSFILVYEVYLLIYYLPKSITIYIGKQYEIITLIVIRRIFKDIANIELSSNWFQNQNDLQFTYDILASITLFFLILLFYKQVKKKAYVSIKKGGDSGRKIQNFVSLKKMMAAILVPVLMIMAVFSLGSWIGDFILHYPDAHLKLKDINTIFFDEFFTILIIIDVLLLLSSFYYSDKFHKIIRNSGFIISTTLIKISFSVSGIVNILLILGAVLFGVLMIFIHNKYELEVLHQKDPPELA
ncbi:MAG: hypothetical protein AAGG75_20615 [Bacteroidota bacterium]